MIYFTVSTRKNHPLEIIRAFERRGKIKQLRNLYGFLFDSPLNGGRNRKGSLRFPLEVIDTLNEHGIGYEFTLTNLAATEEHCRDPHTNQILKRFENPLNGVLTATGVIADYIRKNYPRYKLRASCMWYFDTAEKINRACEKFDEVTLFPVMNDRIEELKKIKYKDRVVIFATQICLKKCGRTSLRHYYFWSLDHIAWYNHQTYKVSYHGRDFEWHFLPPCRGKDCPMEMEDLDKFISLGFNKFKIAQFDFFKERYWGIKPPPIMRAKNRLKAGARKLFGRYRTQETA